MKSFFYYLSIAIIFGLIGWFANTAYHLPKDSNPIAQIKPTPLNKYTIENLGSKEFKASQIEIGEIIKDNPKFVTYKYSMKFSPDFSDNLKTVMGVINIPKGEGVFPLIVMFRGYVDQKEYVTGMGTQPSAKVFAENGYITIAPDFLGYGESDGEAGNIFESRFQTYVTAAVTLKSVSSIEKWNDENIFIWAHSNGGQVALTTLEITGLDYPTVLWAPVTKPFPASILTFIDEADDGGKLLVTNLSDFMETYDTAKFSFTGYLDRIKAPIEINQGTLDPSVPFWWSDSLVQKLKKLEKDVTYIKYPGANHNMTPSWSKVVSDNLVFYGKQL